MGSVRALAIHLLPQQLTASLIHLPWLSDHIPHRVSAKPSPTPPRLSPGMPPLGTMDITGTTEAISSFLCVSEISPTWSFTTVVHCLILTSACSMPTAALGCRNMQQKEINVSLLALASVSFLSVSLLPCFLFLFPPAARECAACFVLSVLLSPCWPFLVRTFFPYREKY